MFLCLIALETYIALLTEACWISHYIYKHCPPDGGRMSTPSSLEGLLLLSCADVAIERRRSRDASRNTKLAT
jgi:hypothetical protein